PSFAQYREALARLGGVQLASDGGESDLHCIDPFSPDAREQLRGTVMTNAGCGAANTVCSINVQGEVSPCSFLGSSFVDGSIRTSSFEDIWRRGHSFTRLRAQDERDEFAGGCRARSQFYAGSAYAKDPWQDAHEGRAPTGKKRSLPIVSSP
ncbi:MAG TPA: SPASM domain-containing protein, partial [Myxococcota bacterium]